MLVFGLGASGILFFIDRQAQAPRSTPNLATAKRFENAFEVCSFSHTQQKCFGGLASLPGRSKDPKAERNQLIAQADLKPAPAFHIVN